LGASDAEERLKGLATFVQVVEAGSFALAAERLRQTRSAVGKSVARLEQRLGTKLFNRNTRRQSLTESGQAFFERCQRALAEIAAAETALDVSRRELVGRLRVAAPLLLGRQLVAPLLSRLLSQHPRLELELALSDRLVDLQGEGFDLAVRLGALRDSATLATRALGRFEFVICAAPAYLLRHGVPQRIADFAGHSAIVYAGGGPESAWQAQDEAGRPQELQVRRRLRLDDVQAIADAALAGLGLARLPRWLVAPHLRSGALQLLGETLHRHEVQVHLVWQQQRQLPMKTRAAIDMLAAELPTALQDA